MNKLTTKNPSQLSRLLSLGVLLLGFALSLTIQSAQSSQATFDEKVVIQLKWLHQFQFAGYYAALEQGFFAEEGLTNVVLKERDPRANNIVQVLNGEAHYGVADSALLLYQTHQVGVRIVAPIFQQSPNVIITLASSGIESPRDLAGRRVRFYDNDSEGFPIMAMLAEQGLLEQGVIRQPFTQDYGVLLRNETDAMYAYSTNEPFWFREQGVEVNILNPVDYGISMYGDMLFTTDTEMEANPDRIEAMRRAVLRGWEYALDNKEELAQLILDQYSQKKSFEALMYEAHGIEQVVNRFTVPLGHLDRGRLAHILNIYARHGLLDMDLPVEGFVYERASKGSLGLTDDEMAFLQQHRTIRVGVDVDWAPLDFIDSKGFHSGVAADYLDVFSQRLGIAFEVADDLSWTETLKALRNRDVDIVALAANTPERSNYAHFTRPYIRSPMVIVTTERYDFIGSITELASERILVTDGFASHEWLKNNHPELNVEAVSSPIEGLRQVSSGKAAAMVDNLASVGFLIKSEGLSNLKISGQLPRSFDLAVGVRNDWPLLRSILQKTLDSMTPQEHAEIYERWLSINYQTQIDYSKVAPVILGLLIVIMLVFIYTLRLKHLHRHLKLTNGQLTELQQELMVKNQDLEKLSITDKLTDIYNRHKLDAVLKDQVAVALRYKRPMSVILFDLDHFKQVNDRYGHQTGDQVLQVFSSLVSETIRASDVFGRWGGEEFMLVCPETKAEHAAELAQKIIRLIAQQPFEQGFSQTVSAGVAEVKSGQSVDALITECDQKLYQAKQQGRNRLIV